MGQRHPLTKNSVTRTATTKATPLPWPATRAGTTAALPATAIYRVENRWRNHDRTAALLILRLAIWRAAGQPQDID